MKNRCDLNKQRRAMDDYMDKRIECPVVGKKGHDSEPTAV